MQNLQHVLQKNFIPWTQAAPVERIAVARPGMRAADLPEGMQLTPSKIPGERVIVKGGRLYGNVRQVSAYWPQAGMNETEHTRAFWVVAGQVNAQVSNTMLGGRVGDFVLAPSRTPLPADRHPPHLVTSNVAGQSCLLLWMALYRRGFQCWLSEYESDGRRHDRAGENYLFLDGQVIQLFQLLVEEAQGNKNQKVCNGLLAAFGAALQREIEASRYLLPGVVTRPEELPDTETDFTRQLEAYIHQHMNQSLTLERVARELYMSRTQFVRRMRRETGKTFVEFLTAHRISEAQALLRESEWTTQTIAQFLGFKSPTYFHALFRDHVDCTPGEYRIRHRNKQNRPI